MLPKLSIGMGAIVLLQPSLGGGPYSLLQSIIMQARHDKLTYNYFNKEELNCKTLTQVMILLHLLGHHRVQDHAVFLPIAIK